MPIDVADPGDNSYLCFFSDFVLESKSVAGIIKIDGVVRTRAR
jgi:hypothetical protein